MNERDRVMANVRRALARDGTQRARPVPPLIEEPITRLVHSDLGLAELFIRMARDNKMHVDPTSPAELGQKLAQFLRSHDCRRIAVADTGIAATLGVLEGLRRAGFDVVPWHEMTLDALYDSDCAVTPVDHAVAETGSLVIRGTAMQARALSLVPPVHVAIIEPKLLLADLVDLFDVLSADAKPDNTVIITGPSKTADIEMNLVTGVHGPGVVQVFILQ